MMHSDLQLHCALHRIAHLRPACQVREWYDGLWDRAQEFDLAGLYAARYEPHPPQLVYLRMLFERYGAELQAEAEAEGAPRIHLTSFQRDGLWRAKRVLADRRGVLIADEVGLGKTFLAGELIREAVEQRRQRVLVIAPATLRDGPWRKFLDTYMLPVDCVSFEDLVADERLSPETGQGAKLKFAPGEYATVVIDEAHNLRNPSTHRAAALRTLLAGSPPKDVVLLTATPVNNSLWDLYYLLGYFLANDAAFADVGIRSLRDHFGAAMAMNSEDLSPEHLFDVLDAVAVRRTRPFVKRYYPNDSVLGPDGRSIPITFPQPRVLKVDYDLDEMLPGFFERFAHSLDGPAVGGTEADPTALTLARYAPSRYRLDGDAEAYEVQLAGLIRSGLLKRFESSAHAFARTCRKMAASHTLLLAVLDEGHVATGQALLDWPATDADAEGLDDYLELNRERIERAAEYDGEALRTDVEQDRRLLLGWADEAEAVSREDDPKLAALVEQLAAIAQEAEREGIGVEDQRDRRKVLVFSYFADTVDWVYEHPRIRVLHPRWETMSGLCSASWAWQTRPPPPSSPTRWPASTTLGPPIVSTLPAFWTIPPTSRLRGVGARAGIGHEGLEPGRRPGEPHARGSRRDAPSGRAGTRAPAARADDRGRRCADRCPPGTVPGADRAFDPCRDERPG